jgi:hypothetical protein
MHNKTGSESGSWKDVVSALRENPVRKDSMCWVDGATGRQPVRGWFCITIRLDRRRNRVRIRLLIFVVPERDPNRPPGGPNEKVCHRFLRHHGRGFGEPA